MKKIAVFLLNFIINIFCAQSQIMENGNFALNDGNTSVTFPCGSYGIIMKDVDNWHISHGSPHFWNTPKEGSLYMNDAGGVGEGIMGGYPFIAGETYIINLGLPYGAQKMRLVTTNMPPPVSPRECDPITCEINRYNGIPPVPSSFPTDINREEIAISETLPEGNTLIMYTPANNYSYIMLFPFNPTKCYPSTGLLVDYVWITRACKYETYIPKVGTSTPAPIHDVHGYSYFLHIGSSFGTTPLVPLETHNNRSTYFRASQYIEINNVFLSELQSANEFIAEIDPYICNELPPEIDLLPGTYSKSSSHANTNHTSTNTINSVNSSFNTTVIRKESEVAIYPNPNDGTFNVSLPNVNNYDIIVTNTTGTVIYQTKVSGAYKLAIKIQDVAPGNYFVTISNDHFKEVKRMVIIH